MTKIKPKIKGGTVVAKAYNRLAECVTLGLERGWWRAHKHTKPTTEQIHEKQYDAIMLEICEAFDFPDHEWEP